MNLQRLRYSMYGVAFIVGVVAVVALSIAQFNRVFTSSDPLKVHAPRAGLLLTSGSDVKMRGVTIGHVTSLSATASGADLELAITPDELHLIPSDASAQIVPPTMFGGKYVEIIPPAHPSTEPIASGATIDATHVTVEINDTFAHLMGLLEATKPATVNAALTALATALQGRGTEAGELLTRIDTYLHEINPSLGTLQHDMTLGRSVLTTYANLTPALLQTARNTITTSDSIQANQASLDAFLLSLTTVSNKTSTFLQQNQHNLVTTLNVMTPLDRTLAEYSAEFPCFFTALAKTGLPLAEDAIGGKQPGLGVLAQFLPTEKPYMYPQDLPTIGADRGANCYGLPNIPMGHQDPHQVFNTGRDPYQDDSKQGGLTLGNLVELFFGPIRSQTP